MYLLDTHALLWALAGDARLGAKAGEVFDDTTANVVVSAASIWEIAIKASLGKLTLARPLPDLVHRELPEQGISVLGIEGRHVQAVEALPWHHRDPFDRLLVATALVDGWTVVTRDEVFGGYGVRTVW